MKWINRYIPFYEMNEKDIYRFMKFTIEKVVHYKIFAGEPKNNKNKLTITLARLPKLSKGFTIAKL